jgi:hypothetical protein
MEITINKQVTEKQTISLPQPKYVCYNDAIYWRFADVDGKLMAVHFSSNVGSTFDLTVNEMFGAESYANAFFCNGDGYKEITATEFDEVLKTALQQNGLI